MTEKKLLNFMDAVRFAFTAYFTHFLPFFITTIVVFIPSAFGYSIPHLLQLEALKNLPPRALFSLMISLFIIVYVLAFFLATFIRFLQLRAGLRLYDGTRVTWQEFFALPTFSEFFTFAGTQILLYIRCVFGLLLLVVGLFYFATKYFFAGIPFLDHKAQTVRQDSAVNRDLTQGIKLRLLGYMLGLGFLIGIVFFFVTLLSVLYLNENVLILSFFVMALYLIFIPVFNLISVHLYKQVVPQVRVQESIRKEVA